ncbi:MAG: hypothetical protein ACRDNL_12485, partial [Spirillospora sp.]
LRLPRSANAAAVVAELARTHDVRDISLREAGIEDVLASLYRGDQAYRRPGRPAAPRRKGRAVG